MEPQKQQLESLDTKSLTRLVLSMQQQVSAQAELLQELQGLLAHSKVKAAESDDAATQDASSCPYCQCDWVYRSN